MMKEQMASLYEMAEEDRKNERAHQAQGELLRRSFLKQGGGEASFRFAC